MAKMNWDRVRDWDRVRGDRSDMELADARDERWLEREHEREATRAQLRAAGQAPPGKASGADDRRGPTGGSKDSSKQPIAGKNRSKLGADELAGALGVTRGQLNAARRAENVASSGLDGMTPAARRERVAARLGITAVELKLLRQALGGTTTSAPQRVGMLVRQVSGVATNPVQAKAPKATGSTSKRQKKSKAASTTPQGRTIYVTPWGNVVHLYHDCHSARGFRHSMDPDPPIYRVPVSDPCCRGRRVCGTCANHDSITGKQIEGQLRKLHGKAFDEGDWERHGWNRPTPSGTPINDKHRT